jgi:hypothetical protein
VSITILYIGECFASPSDGAHIEKINKFLLEFHLYFIQFQNLVIFEVSFLTIGPIMGVIEVMLRKNI